MRRIDALDGVRFVAVALVMAYHLGVPGASAGYLGVDVFFVLSGYLITSLLLQEAVAGRVDLLAFWTRRARRLMPGLLVVIAAVLLWGAFVAPSVLRDNLRGDIGATLEYVANWHFITQTSYFSDSGVVSPLRHMWSLAVEEQFYLAWPIALAVITLVLKSRRGRLLAIGALAGAGVTVSTIRLAMFWAGQRDRAYLGTDTRIFEPLLGAVLAVALTSTVARNAAVRAHWSLVVAGVSGLVWGLVSLGARGGAPGGYGNGGALIVASATALLVAAVVTRSSTVTAALAFAPAAYLGRLSYGLYLWHWPLQVWTRSGGWWDLSGWPQPLRIVTVCSLTLACAAASYHLVELPIRYGKLSRALRPGRAFAALAGTAAALFTLNSLAVVPHAGASLGAVTKTIVLVGDSVPQRLAFQLSNAAGRYGYTVVAATRGSCPATGVAVVGTDGRPWGAGTACSTDVPARQDTAVAQYRPQLVIWWSRYELADRVTPSGKPIRFGSPAYWAAQRLAFARRTAALTAKGAHVVAVQVERTGLGIRTRCRPQHCGPFLFRLVHSTRAQDIWNSFLASHRSGAVRSISIQGLVCHDRASPCDDRLPDGALARPDGTHYGPAAAPTVAAAVIVRSLHAIGVHAG